MLTTIQDAVKLFLPYKRKTNSSSGWISFNAPCCHHNGENADTRGRGGVIFDAGGSVNYHCFNCNYKATYRTGYHLNYKFRKWLNWLGASEAEVKKLVIDALRVKELAPPERFKEEVEHEEVVFPPRPLPTGAKEFTQLATFYELGNNGNYENVPSDFYNAVSYVQNRRVDMVKYDFYWTEDPEHNMHKRVIIPCYWKGELIGSTARTLEDGIKPKYYADYASNFVFNMDNQVSDNKVVLVMEGPFDAMAVDGVAVLSNECSEIQADIIDSMGKEVIVVPDFDVKTVKGKQVWAGEKLVDQALEYGWAVSFPVWREEVKDVAEANEKYGKLFTMKAILDGKQTSRLKIELMKRKINA